MKTLLEKLFKFLGLLVLIIVVSLIPELIGGNIAEYLEEKLGEHYFWILAGTGLVALLLVTLWTEGDKIFKKKKGEPTAEAVSEDNLQKIRAGLLESYQERLQSKLAARFPINLELKYSTEGTNTKADIYDNKTIRSTKIKEELIHLFDKHRGRLLIIGEPGAGKTTLLLQLAYQLLYRQDPVITDIPIIINMATWRKRFSSVEEWLRELLPQMGFSKALVEQLLTENRLLPLFDGLDELGEGLRQPCLEAIAAYGKKQERQYVICSRIVEYAETVDAPVYCQIMVKPLTITQIREGLQEVNSPETNGILDAMKKDPLLKEAIKTPFYLNTVQLLFAASKVWEEFEFKAETLEGRQREIVEFFVTDATSGFEKYSSDQVKKYLGFLADRMTWKGLVEFELVDLQYDWGRFGRWELVIAKFLGRLSDSLFVGLLVCLFIGQFESLSGGLVVGLVVGLLIGLVNGLGTDPVEIKTKDSVNWSFSYFKAQLKTYLVFGLFMGLIFGLAIGLLVGLVFGVLAGLSTGLIEGLIFQLKQITSFLKVTQPYHRFRASMWALHFSILQYWHLKRLLRRKGLLPKKLVAFLKRATSQDILESNGGSWRFRHQILQEYFAGYWGVVYGAAFPRGEEEENKNTFNKNSDQL